MSRSPVAVLVASLADGGIGKTRVHLINEFARLGIPVDLLVARADSPYMHALHSDVRVVTLGTSHALSSVPPLAWYLRRNRPAALLTQRIRVNMAALRARRFARLATPVYATLNTNLTRQYLTAMGLA